MFEYNFVEQIYKYYSPILLYNNNIDKYTLFADNTIIGTTEKVYYQIYLKDIVYKTNYRTGALFYFDSQYIHYTIYNMKYTLYIQQQRYCFILLLLYGPLVIV